MLPLTLTNKQVEKRIKRILELAEKELNPIASHIILKVKSTDIIPIFAELDADSGYFFKVDLPQVNSYHYWIDWTEELGAWVEKDGLQATIVIKQSRLIAPEPIESSLITCLTSHVAATCLCLQGQIAIHANVITVKNSLQDSLQDKAIAFAGDSGQGKSTLTAYCVSQGAGFITDDVLVLDNQGVAKLGSSRIKLYPSLAEQLGLEVQAENDYKIHYNPEQLGATIVEKPSPVKTLYILEESPNSTIYSETLSLGQAITHLIRHSYHSSVVMKDNPNLFNEYIDLAQRIQVKKLFYPRELSLLKEVYRYLQQDK